MLLTGAGGRKETNLTIQEQVDEIKELDKLYHVFEDNPTPENRAAYETALRASRGPVLKKFWKPVRQTRTEKDLPDSLQRNKINAVMRMSLESADVDTLRRWRDVLLENQDIMTKRLVEIYKALDEKLAESAEVSD